MGYSDRMGAWRVRGKIIAFFWQGCLSIGPKIQKPTCISEIFALIRAISAQRWFQSVCFNLIIWTLIESWTTRVSEVPFIAFVITLFSTNFEVDAQIIFMQCKISIQKIISHRRFKKKTVSFVGAFRRIVLIFGNRWANYLWNLAAPWYHLKCTCRVVK